MAEHKMLLTGNLTDHIIYSVKLSAGSEYKMNAIQTNQRLDFLDAAKGIGIILVILGHAFRDEMRIVSNFCEFVYQTIYFFHMPLFFVISGFTFGISYSKYINDPLRYLKKKTVSQIVPILSYGTVIYVCFFVAYQIPVFQEALSATGYQLYPYPKYLLLTALWENPYAVHLWYLWVLCLVSIIAFLYFRLSSGVARSKLYFAIYSLILYVLQIFFNFPIVLARVLQYTIYFTAGIVLVSCQKLLSAKCKAICATGIAGWLFLLGYCALQALHYDLGILNQPLVFALCKLVSNMFVILSILRLACRLTSCAPLLYCGTQSYNIYLLHQPFCCGFVGVILYNKFQLPAFPVFVICCLLSVLLPIAFTTVCKKCKPVGKLAKLLFHIT